MDINLNRPKIEEFTPITVEIKVETQSEMDMLATIFNSLEFDKIVKPIFDCTLYGIDSTDSIDFNNRDKEFHKALKKY